MHTVLVDMRARLARSACPDRIFGVTIEVGKQAGLVGRRRVLDSTPLYDAVATMDTVTLVRSAIRGLLAAAGDLEAGLRGLLARDDDYAAAGKPACDYDDPAAREALVDALARDARALLAAYHDEMILMTIEPGEEHNSRLIEASGCSEDMARKGDSRFEYFLKPGSVSRG